MSRSRGSRRSKPCHRRRLSASLRHGPRHRRGTGAYFNLPASKEGFIPGAANLRLPRLVGIKLAREGIFFERVFHADTPEGRRICDEVVPAAEMDAAIEANAAQLMGAGITSAVSNRKALRVGEEPLTIFRRYMATYARRRALPLRCEADRESRAQLEARQPAHVTPSRFADRQASGKP